MGDFDKGQDAGGKPDQDMGEKPGADQQQQQQQQQGGKPDEGQGKPDQMK